AHALARDEGRHEVQAIAFSADGTKLATSSGEVIGMWDMETGRQLRALFEHYPRVLALAFSPDGKLLASGGRDTVIRLWAEETGRREERITYTRAPPARCGRGPSPPAASYSSPSAPTRPRSSGRCRSRCARGGEVPASPDLSPRPRSLMLGGRARNRHPREPP